MQAWSVIQPEKRTDVTGLAPAFGVDRLLFGAFQTLWGGGGPILRSLCEGSEYFECMLGAPVFFSILPFQSIHRELNSQEGRWSRSQTGLGALHSGPL